MIEVSYVQAHMLVFISTLLLTMYFLFLGNFSRNILTVYFWVHALTYLGINFIIFAQDFLHHFDTQAIKAMMFDTTYKNFPLYLIAGLCVIGNYIVLDHIAKKYSMSKIIALSQLSIIISTIGYHFLGDQMTTDSVIGIIIIMLGSAISGLTHFSLKKPKTIIKEYDYHLLGWCSLIAFCVAIPEIITYLCTAHHNPTTHHLLKLMTKHTRGIPFMTVIPLYMNIGLQLCNISLLLLWIYRRHQTSSLNNMIHNQKKTLLLLTATHIGYVYCYFTAFDIIENKNIISAISQLYLPLTMIAGVLLLGQKWTKYEAIGMAIITCGCMFSIITEI